MTDFETYKKLLESSKTEYTTWEDGTWYVTWYVVSVENEYSYFYFFFDKYTGIHTHVEFSSKVYSE